MGYHRAVIECEVSLMDSSDSGLSAQFPSSIPAYFLTGDKDEALPLDMSNGVERFFAPGKYRREIISGADHWLLQVSTNQLGQKTR